MAGDTDHLPVNFVSTRDGVRVAYSEIGDGPPIVYVRGVNSHLENMWEDPDSRSYFLALARAHRLVRFDARGNGLSDRNVQAITLEGLVEDVRAVVDDLGLDEVTLYGQGFGGPIAIAYAAEHPERVANLILFGTYARGEALRELESFAELFRTMPDAAYTWLVHQSYPGSDTIPLRKIRAQPQGVDPETAAEFFSMAARIDVSGLLPAVRARTLVLHPQRSGIPATVGREVAAGIPGARFVLFGGSSYNPWGEDAASSLRPIGEFLGSPLGAEELAPARERRLATVLFTDIVGSTERLAGMGDEPWATLLQRHETEVRNTLDHFGGRYVLDTGDGMLATFDGPAQAIRCAVAIREALRALDIEIRAGIHTGEMETTGERLSGISVHVASRVLDAAGPGEILVSRTVADLVAGSGFQLADRGERDLKGVPGRWTLFSIEG